MKKTALVIGATGLIGKALVYELLKQDAISKVITLTRKPLVLDQTDLADKRPNDKKLNQQRFENHTIDFSKLAQYSEHFKQVDMLFSCLGTTKKLAGSINNQRVVDVDYQYDAAKLAYECGVEEYFLVSSSGASASSISPYLKMKGELENKVIALGFKRCVILRPSLLIGERADKRPGEFFAGKVMPLLSCVPLLNKYRPIKGIEVAQKMAQLAIEDINSSAVKSVKYYTLDEVFVTE